MKEGSKWCQGINTSNKSDTLTVSPHVMMACDDGTCIMLFRPIRVSKQDYLFNHGKKYLLFASSCLGVIIVLTWFSSCELFWAHLWKTALFPLRQVVPSLACTLESPGIFKKTSHAQTQPRPKKSEPERWDPDICIFKISPGDYNAQSRLKNTDVRWCHGRNTESKTFTYLKRND